MVIKNKFGIVTTLLIHLYCQYDKTKNLSIMTTYFFDYANGSYNVDGNSVIIDSTTKEITVNNAVYSGQEATDLYCRIWDVMNSMHTSFTNAISWVLFRNK